MAVDALTVRARTRDGVRATLLLCDYAAVAEGKLNILGAGWTTTHNVTTHAIAILLEVPWDRTNAMMTIRLELKEQDGQAVVQQGPAGPLPVRVDGEFEVGRPPGMHPGSSIPVPFAFPVSLQLAQGQRYYWEFSVNGDTQEHWVLPFNTRPPMPAPGGPTDFQLPQP